NNRPLYCGPNRCCGRSSGRSRRTHTSAAKSLAHSASASAPPASAPPPHPHGAAAYAVTGGALAAYTVAGFRSESVAGINRNRWPTSFRNRWPTYVGISTLGAERSAAGEDHSRIVSQYELMVQIHHRSNIVDFGKGGTPDPGW